MFEYILKKLVLCIQIRFVSTEKTTRIASRASCLEVYLPRDPKAQTHVVMVTTVKQTACILYNAILMCKEANGGWNGERTCNNACRDCLLVRPQIHYNGQNLLSVGCTALSLYCQNSLCLRQSSSYRVIKPSSSISQHILFLYH